MENIINRTNPWRRRIFGLLYLVSVVAIFSSCHPGEEEPGGEFRGQPMVVSSSGVDAIGPYFTKDHEGAPILVWNEKLAGGDSTGYVVKYGKFSKNGDELLVSREVIPSRGCSTSGESMSKIAYRDDGSIVAVFARRMPT